MCETFHHFLQAMVEQGFIPEEYFDLYGIAVDRDMNGDEVLKLATIAQESHQRSKCLTHEFQVHLRKERLLQIQRKERQRKEVVNSKHQELIDANRETVHLLNKMCQKKGLIGDSDFGEEHLEHCTLDMFEKLGAKELTPFILAHDTKYKMKMSIPKKGSAEEARGGAVNKISIAFKCIGKPNLVEGNMPYDLSQELVEEEDEAASTFITEVLTLTKDDEVLPSELLSNEQWVKFVVSIFELEKLDISGAVDQDMKDKADLLAKLLQERYKDHVKKRIKTVSRRTHWSMKLAYKNLAVSAACMVLSNHVKMDLKCLDESACLLAINHNNFLPTAAIQDGEGCYLYFDLNRGVFVRSGKVTRRGFVVRGDEHHKASKEIKSSSHFYFVYPSKESTRADKRDKLGIFEHLTMLIGAGFNPKSHDAKLVDKDWKEGGLLIMSEDDKKYIKKSMDKDLASIQKFQDIVAYQFEFGYDLALSPEMNVSQSPGFESVLGVFGGEV